MEIGQKYMAKQMLASRSVATQVVVIGTVKFCERKKGRCSDGCFKPEDSVVGVTRQIMGLGRNEQCVERRG
jgi:hypothetical protein